MKLIDAQSTADSLIAFEKALQPPYRAKHHKPSPKTMRDAKELEAALRAYKEGIIARRLADKIRKGEKYE